MASRLETNFNRLLHRCEAMAAERGKDSWRLEKYVASLQDQLTELGKSPSKPGHETLADYQRKVEFLKGLIEAEKLSSASDKAMAANLLAPGRSISQVGSTPSKELHLQATARFQNDMRDELLGKPKDTESDSGLRQRNRGQQEDEDLDTVLQHHNKIQEQLANEMLVLARNLKDNAQSANRIIKDDTKKVQDSSGLAESNLAKLKVESERLEEHTQKSCNWWIWIMLAIVCITFMWMILFMKMFRKKVVVPVAPES